MGPLQKAYIKTKEDTLRAEYELTLADGAQKPDSVLRHLEILKKAAWDKRKAAFKAWMESNE